MARLERILVPLAVVLAGAAAGAAAGGGAEEFGDKVVPAWPSSPQKNEQRQQVVQPFETVSRTPDAFPFLVHVISYMGQGPMYCAGAVIGERHVLTAAHCLGGAARNEPVSRTVVVAGRGALLDAPAFDVIDELFYWPKEKERVEADVAILKLDRSMSSAGGVEPIPLQKDSENQQHCFLIGWPSAAEADVRGKGQGADALSVVPLSVVKRRRCLSRRSKYVPRMDLLCVGRRRQDRDTCEEQPGSPLVCNGALAGLAVGGHGCAVTDFALSYTSAAYYARWAVAAVREGLRDDPRNMTRQMQGPTRLIYSPRPRPRPRPPRHLAPTAGYERS